MTLLEPRCYSAMHNSCINSTTASHMGGSSHTFLSSRPILARSSSLAFTVSSQRFFSS